VTRTPLQASKLLSLSHSLNFLFDRISLAANLGSSYAMVRKRPLKEDVSFDELLEFAQIKILKCYKIWKQKKR
jgi:hypothetical protein